MIIFTYGMLCLMTVVLKVKVFIAFCSFRYLGSLENFPEQKKVGLDGAFWKTRDNAERSFLKLPRSSCLIRDTMRALRRLRVRVKEGHQYSVCGERARVKGGQFIEDSAPLIFSLRLLCDHKRVGIKRFSLHFWSESLFSSFRFDKINKSFYNLLPRVNFYKHFSNVQIYVDCYQGANRFIFLKSRSPICLLKPTIYILDHRSTIDAFSVR